MRGTGGGRPLPGVPHCEGTGTRCTRKHGVTVAHRGADRHASACDRSAPLALSCRQLAAGARLRARGPSPPSRFFAAKPADLSLDEVVDLSIENRLGVARLDSRTQVLDALVGVQDIVADLGAPAACRLTAQLGHLRRVLLALAFKQLGLQDRHGGRAVLDLASLILAGDNDPARQVRDPDGGIGGVDTLAAGSAGAVDVDPDLVLWNVDVIGG